MKAVKDLVVGIEAITYSTDGTQANWDDAKRFFADWGLADGGHTEARQRWLTLNGGEVWVARPDDASLPPPMEPGPTLRSVTWGVTNDQALNEMAEVLAGADGFARPDAHTVRVLDPHGLQLDFVVSRKKAVAVQGSASNAWGDVRRVDQPSPIYDRATPIEVGHVVLFTDKLAEARAFYERLGFVLSDQYPQRGAFLRSASEGGHHDLFLLEVPNRPTGLNHVAFAVRDIHEVFGGGLHMSRCGWKTQLGPGRHPVSSAYFWYFTNPCGGLIEYNADEDHLTANWTPRDFTPGPTVFAEWAIEGGIDGHTRRQVSAKGPDGQFLTAKKA